MAARLRASGFDVLFVCPEGEYVEKLVALGYRVKCLPMNRRSLNPLAALHTIRSLISILRVERPAILHSFTIKSAVFGSIAARIAGVPAWINAIAGMGFVFAGGTLYARMLRPAVELLMRITLDSRRARLIVQNGDDAAYFGGRRIVRRDRIRLIRGSGVDCRRFAPRSPDRTPSAFRVLFAARLLYDKGLGEFVQAARILKNEGRPVQFLVAGRPDPGNPRSVGAEDLEQWRREGLIELLGHVDDMAVLLSTVDAFVLPTAYREGVPRSLLEAGACALALVTTDTAGCRDVVKDGVTGLLVPVRDPVAVADALRRLIEEPDLALRLGAAARDLVVKEFDEERVLDQTAAVYRELIAC